MDTLSAFFMGMKNRGKELMVFDWHRAARIIRDRKAKNAAAGLKDDWEWTGGEIFRNGKPIKSDYTYLASTWAIPQLSVDGELIDCFIMKSESPGWDAHTKWPQSALDILKEEEK